MSIEYPMAGFRRPGVEVRRRDWKCTECKHPANAYKQRYCDDCLRIPEIAESERQRSLDKMRNSKSHRKAKRTSA